MCGWFGVGIRGLVSGGWWPLANSGSGTTRRNSAPFSGGLYHTRLLLFRKGVVCALSLHSTHRPGAFSSSVGHQLVSQARLWAGRCKKHHHGPRVNRQFMYEPRRCSAAPRTSRLSIHYSWEKTLWEPVLPAKGEKEVTKKKRKRKEGRVFFFEE